MEREALDRIVQQAMFLGQVQYMTMIEPETDKMKQREAKGEVGRRGCEPEGLGEWGQGRRGRRRKDGEGNAPVYYSLKEIQRQITVTEMVKGKITQIT